MARKARIHYPGACYHVILRGNGGNKIFLDKKDRSRFFFLLQEGTERYRHRIHAYCLMTNHVHLVIQVSDIALSRIIQNISFRYTRYVNHRKKQVGHLFQGRYKALLIDADCYLLELLRYIHNNPVRAGIVKSANQYAWSSHHAYLGKENVPWLTTEWVLAQFAKQEKKAIMLYQDFIMDGKDEEHRKDFYQGNIEGCILGEDRFAEEAFAKASQEMACRVTLEQVVDTVCEHYSISVDAMTSGSREKRVSEPRAMAALLVRNMPHLRLMDLSRKLRRDLSGLSQAASRFERKLDSNENLRKKVKKIKAFFE